MTDIQMMEERLVKLDRDVREVKQSCLTGLTTEELQSIHGLIQRQVKLIGKTQSDNNVSETLAAVSTLATLASLVSKPTD